MVGLITAAALFFLLYLKFYSAKQCWNHSNKGKLMDKSVYSYYPRWVLMWWCCLKRCEAIIGIVLLVELFDTPTIITFTSVRRGKKCHCQFLLQNLSWCGFFWNCHNSALPKSDLQGISKAKSDLISFNFPFQLIWFHKTTSMSVFPTIDAFSVFASCV